MVRTLSNESQFDQISRGSDPPEQKRNYNRLIIFREGDAARDERSREGDQNAFSFAPIDCAQELDVPKAPLFAAIRTN
jgi:hypothetical protein